MHYSHGDPQQKTSSAHPCLHSFQIFFWFKATTEIEAKHIVHLQENVFDPFDNLGCPVTSLSTSSVMLGSSTALVIQANQADTMTSKGEMVLREIRKSYYASRILQKLSFLEIKSMYQQINQKE